MAILISEALQAKAAAVYAGKVMVRQSAASLASLAAEPIQDPRTQDSVQISAAGLTALREAAEKLRLAAEAQAAETENAESGAKDVHEELPLLRKAAGGRR